MSLRYRLFLWVSALFLMTSLVGSFVESFVTKNALKRAKSTLCQKILESKEQVRQSLQEYLSYQILENQAKIDVLLNTISFSTPQLVKFAPTIENLEQGTTMGCADLLQANRWIDFIQNTNQGALTGLIIPQSPPFPHALRISIDSDLSWVFFAQGADPFIGVRLFSIDQEYPSEDLSEEQVEESDLKIPETYLLFALNQIADAPSFNTLADLDLVLAPPWIEGHTISLKPFLRAIERARVGLKKGTLLSPEITGKEIQEKLNAEGAWEEILINPFPNGNMLALLPEEKFLQEKVNDLSMRNGEINILWILQSLFGLKIFDQHPLPSPTAVATFKENYNTGPSAFLKDLFFTSKIFDDAQYYAQNTPPNPTSNIAATLAIIKPQNVDALFLGNTAQFIAKTAEQKRVGYLTLACNVDTIMQQLVLTLDQAVFLVTGKEVASAFLANQEKLKPSQEHHLLLAELLSQSVGITKWADRDYFFMHVTPFASLDLHFFFFNPTEKEFALLHNLEKGSQEIAKSIFFNIQLCGCIVLLLTIIFLHYFAKSITRPIIQLASAAKEIKEGRLEQVCIPKPKAAWHKDEVTSLCQSFEEMVQGLKEKEKVKGILNKIVSQEIAQEILKGQIHLGGEEKCVSVLFADIRNFTRMTQSMLPHQVVDLLNTCMTKISLCVDHYGGVIDKYVGDEVMALFGAPVAKPDSALCAIKSALEMRAVLEEWNQERKRQGLALVEMGIAIHTGEVLAGNMGAENRLNYTVIGSNVNLAARICSVAKGMEILISKETLEQEKIKESIAYEELPPVSLKGFDLPINLYRVKGLVKP